MTRNLVRFPLTATVAAIALAPAGAQGPIGTLPRGQYACELPGDAAGPVGHPQPDAGFAVQSSSRYAAPQGAGTYLRRGDSVVLTSGPRQGESYALKSEGTLRLVEGGKAGSLRCINSRK